MLVARGAPDAGLGGLPGTRLGRISSCRCCGQSCRPRCLEALPVSQGLLPFPVSLLLAPEGALSHHGTRIPASRRGLSRTIPPPPATSVPLLNCYGTKALVRIWNDDRKGERGRKNACWLGPCAHGPGALRPPWEQSQHRPRTSCRVKSS